jgi:hypothetical protein
MRRIALLWAAFCPIAFAQLDSNSITVSASNNVALQPDQAIFSVTVTSPQSTGLDDILAAVAGSGITIANLTGVTTAATLSVYGSGSTNAPPPMLAWTFSLLGPLANTKATVASLTTLQQSIATANNGLTLSFGIVGTQVSPQLAQSQTCSFPNLIANATTQAQSLAAAGGLALGSILAISSSTASAVVAADFLVGAATPPCTITVKFNVTRN